MQFAFLVIFLKIRKARVCYIATKLFWSFYFHDVEALKNYVFHVFYYRVLFQRCGAVGFIYLSLYFLGTVRHEYRAVWNALAHLHSDRTFHRVRHVRWWLAKALQHVYTDNNG